MRGILACCLFCAFVTGVAKKAAGAELVYAVDFDDPTVSEAVRECPFARVEKDFEGTSFLTVTVPPGKTNLTEPVAVVLPFDLEKAGVPGGTLFGEADIQFADVTKPTATWNGVKFMLVFATQGKTEYPDFNPGINANHGSRSWYRAQSSIAVPADAAKTARLNLGLQDASGTVSFRNIRFYRGEAPKSVLRQNPVPQARYTDAVLKRPVARGVMSSSEFNEADFAELAKWNANLIRWQLNRPYRANYPLGEYKEYLAGKLRELPSVLDTAKKTGLAVVIDLHPFEGGKLVLSTPEGREYLFRVWKDIVAIAKGHPAVWGYDILNEPHSRNLRPGDPSWPEIAAKLVAQIRADDPETPIIVESDPIANPDHLEFLPIFDEVNVIYSFHFYIPGELTHQLNPENRPFRRYPDEAAGWNKEFLRRHLAKAKEFADKTGARLYVGEFGCIRWAPGADRYLADCIELFEEYGWDWSYHAFREWSGWSVEHGEDPADDNPAAVDTTRKKLLLEYFRKNPPNQAAPRDTGETPHAPAVPSAAKPEMTTADGVIFRPDFAAANPSWTFTVEGCEVRGEPLDRDAYRLEVTRNDGRRQDNTHIQWIVNYAGAFVPGVPHRFEATLKANRRVRLATQILLRKAPYTRIAERVDTLEPDTPIRLDLAFTPDDATPGGPYRVPCLMLGEAEAGTVLEIRDLALHAPLPAGYAIAPPTVDRAAMDIVQVVEASPATRKYRVLFLGNSITRHGPNAGLGWNNDGGMAASVPENDYVHRFRALAEAEKVLPADTGMETLFLAVGGGKLEHHYNRMDDWRAAQADLIVVQLGENDPVGAEGPAGFGKAYAKLIDQILSISPTPKIVCLGVWQPGDHKGEYNPEPGKDSMVREVAKARGIPFASVARYATDPACRGWGENRGVRWHPNDRGMAGYATALLEAWRPLLPNDGDRP